MRRLSKISGGGGAAMVVVVVAWAGTVDAAVGTVPDDGGSDRALEQFVALGEQYGYTLIDPACSQSPSEGTDVTYSCYAMTTLGSPFIASTTLAGADVVEFDVIAAPAGATAVPAAPAPDPEQPGVDDATGAQPQLFDALAYFAALFSGDPDQIAGLQALTAPGSPAEAYALYQIEFVQTVREHDNQTIEPVNVFLRADGLVVCVTAESCVDVTGLRVVDGRLVSFDVEGESIADRLARPTEPIPVGLSTAEVRAAYRSVTSDRLVVYIEVVSSDQVSFELSAAVYVDAEGDQTPVNREHSVGALDIDAKGTTTAALAFDSASPGGTVRFLVYPTDGSAPLAAVLPITGFTTPTD